MNDLATIIQTENPKLRLVSRALELKEIGSKAMQSCIKKMHATLAAEEDGVALAAPQISVNLRIFVLSPKLFEGNTAHEPLVYINPVITKRSRVKVLFDEGCLSVRSVYGKIKRHEKVTVRALDENGQEFTRGGSGVLAEVFQHEIDHLDGILFTDTATKLRDLKEKLSE